MKIIRDDRSLRLSICPKKKKHNIFNEISRANLPALMSNLRQNGIDFFAVHRIRSMRPQTHIYCLNFAFLVQVSAAEMYTEKHQIPYKFLYHRICVMNVCVCHVIFCLIIDSVAFRAS